VIGGGVIGLELGSVYQRFGTEVQVIEFMDRLIPAADIEISKNFLKILTKKGLKIQTSTKVIGGKNHGTHGTVDIQPVAGGSTTTLSADHILISTGRRPYSTGLGAKEVGIKFDNKDRIVIDKHYKTNVGNIFAIGDIVAGPMLAHKAEEEGIACVEHIAGKGGHVNYNAIPSVVYTHPEVAWVGKTEEELKAEG
jgi:dihydrolipoamide dehydrogenase